MSQEQINPPCSAQHFAERTQAEYREWCARFYPKDVLNEEGLKSLDGLHAWREQAVVHLRRVSSLEEERDAAIARAEALQRQLESQKDEWLAWQDKRARLEKAEEELNLIKDRALRSISMGHHVSNPPSLPSSASATRDELGTHPRAPRSNS